MTTHTPWCPFDGCPTCADENARLMGVDNPLPLSSEKSARSGPIELMKESM